MLAPTDLQRPVTNRPPTPSLPLEGGGGNGATAFPPPLRGRVREGGISSGRHPIKLSPWLTNKPEACAATRRMPKRSSGRCFGASSSPAIVSAGRCRSVPTSSISPASRRTWSSRSTAGSMLSPSKGTDGAQRGLKLAATKSCGSGTTRCSGTQMACFRASYAPLGTKRPPTPSLPLQGGGGNSTKTSRALRLVPILRGDRLA